MDVNTATTRPVALVLDDGVRDEAGARVVPAIQGPLVRSGRRVIVARLNLAGGERHEVFMPRMPRRPDPKEGDQPLLQMRWRVQLYGD